MAFQTRRPSRVVAAVCATAMLAGVGMAQSAWSQTPGPRPGIVINPDAPIAQPPPHRVLRPPTAVNPNNPPPATDSAPQVCETGVDADRDGLDDGCEDRLLNRFAPVLFLPVNGLLSGPAGRFWERPANVDWFLSRARLRFHNDGGCFDETITDTVTQAGLLGHRKPTKNSQLGGCKPESQIIDSQAGPWNDGHQFFLQLKDDRSRIGAETPEEWIVYGHAYQNQLGGMNLQYWFFYAYNDGTSEVNHEGEWETLIVQLNPDRTPTLVVYCQHTSCSDTRTAAQAEWLQGRPVAYVADGTHATYPTLASCNQFRVVEGGMDNCSGDPAHRWFTAAGSKGAAQGFQGGGVVNVGEAKFPRNGQVFVNFVGRWGKKGTTDITSGPKTPPLQDRWTLAGAN